MIFKSRGQQPENHYMPSLTDKLHYRQYPKIEHIMNYVSQEGGPGVITTTQLFQFLGKEIGTPKMC